MNTDDWVDEFRVLDLDTGDFVDLDGVV